jgi:hypothetical protein
MANGNQQPSSGSQGAKPSSTTTTSKPSSQGLIGSAGVKPSGTVERSGTIPSVSVIRDASRSFKSE